VFTSHSYAQNINFQYLFNPHSTEQDSENQERDFPFE
jgi:hypothetical protein